MASITFYGAAQQVTGSCYLIRTGSSCLLMECGIQQGEDADEPRYAYEFPFDPREVDAVVLSHAHLDHSGMVPLLVRKGFSGPVFVTRATGELLPIMHKDAAHLQMKDVEWENKRRRRAGKPLIEPPYTLEDVEQELALCEPLQYGERHTILPDVELRFSDAGHILGSAIVELWLGKDKPHKLVFSGDLGNSNSPLLRDPAIIEEADTLLLESTYGNRDHRPLDATLDEFREALDAAAESGGNVLIPAFAVGRTQDLLFHLGDFYQQGKLQQEHVYVDSPMATSVSEIYQKNIQCFNQDNPLFRKTMTHVWEQWLPIMEYTREVERSMELNYLSGGAIIIAGSGMCTGGRIRHHLKHNLWRPNAHVIIVGYQAFGTLGRKLVDGAKVVRILGNEIAVKASIHTLGGFSAHAGQSQLVDWASKFHQPKPKLFLVHGEPDSMQTLQQLLSRQHGWDAFMPEAGETFQL